MHCWSCKTYYTVGQVALCVCALAVTKKGHHCIVCAGEPAHSHGAAPFRCFPWMQKKIPKNSGPTCRTNVMLIITLSLKYALQSHFKPVLSIKPCFIRFFQKFANRFKVTQLIESISKCSGLHSRPRSVRSDCLLRVSLLMCRYVWCLICWKPTVYVLLFTTWHFWLSYTGSCYRGR